MAIEQQEQILEMKNASKFLQELAMTSKVDEKKIIDSVQLAVNDNIFLNKNQQKFIVDMVGIAAHMDSYQVGINQISIATYINSCRREKKD